MNPCITAIGTANPANCIAQEDIAEFMSRAHHLQGDEKQRLQALYRATGIKFRYSVIPDYGLSPDNYQFYPPDLDPFPGTGARSELFQTHALPMAVAAVNDCLPAGFDYKGITHLITVSCTGLYAPGLDIELVDALELPTNTRRTAINFMGCYAAFNALRTAKFICSSTLGAQVLIVSVELCSLHFQKNPIPDFVLSNALFGDGAAAALVENSSIGCEIIADHCALVPKGQPDMSWQLGDTGFEMKLSQNIPDLIEDTISQLTAELFMSAGLNSDHIDYYAIHPGGKRILTCIQKALELSDKNCETARSILASYGNMSSATILFVMKEIWNKLNPGDQNKKVLCLAFGPGITLESLILNIKMPE